MNQFLFLISVLFVFPAQASFTRTLNFSNSPHLSDESQIIDMADVGLVYGEFVTFHWGTAATNTTVGTYNAQGGFLKRTGNTAWGFYLGNNYADLNKSRTESTTATSKDVLVVENPINFYWATKTGELAWGLGVLYSSSSNSASKQSQAVMGLSGGMTLGAWDAALLMIPTNTAKNDSDSANAVSVTGKSPINFSTGYTLGDLYTYVQYVTNGYKTTKAATTPKDVSSANMILGFVQNKPWENVGSFFYGASYNSLVEKDDGTTLANTTTVQVPFIIGVEANATDWLVLRASIKENFLIGSTKALNADDSGIRGNNTIAAGAGIKLGKWVIDGTFQNTNAGTLGLGSGFLSDISMTHMF